MTHFNQIPKSGFAFVIPLVIIAFLDIAGVATYQYIKQSSDTVPVANKTETLLSLDSGPT